MKSVRLLDRVSAGWIQVLLEDKKLFNSCCKETDKLIDFSAENLTPAPDKVFECFRYFCPEATKVVIVGQDPYSDGDGLAFSGQMGGSFLNISAASGMKNCDLSLWAMQGVLLINACLTGDSRNRGKGKDKSAMHSHWKPLVEKAINYAILEAKRVSGVTVDVMLWGGVAQKLKIDKTARIHTWCHPSPLSTVNNPGMPKRFALCDHFRVVTSVHWRVERVIVFAADGSAGANRGDSAGCGIHFPATYMGKQNPISGTYRCGLYAKNLVTGGDERLTSPRAEATAVLKGLRLVADSVRNGDVVLVLTDSKITRLGMEKNPGDVKANSDIFGEIGSLRDWISAEGGEIAVLYQRAHVSKVGDYAHSDAELANFEADRAAGIGEKIGGVEPTLIE
jgi:uracil DNA glycosylase/ribonuclease HI